MASGRRPSGVRDGGRGASAMSRTAGDGALLRRELRRVWRLLETAMDAWGGQAAVFVGEIRRLAEEAAALRGRRDRLEAEVRDLKRRLAVHENYNNPDRGTVTARERKRHRRKLMEREAEEAEEEEEGTAGDAAECGGVRGTGLRKRGGQPGSAGVSFTLKPDKGLEEWHAPEECAVCGRTDIVHLAPVWKIMFEMHKCGGLFCYMEVSVPAACVPCAVVTYPDTPSLPGSSCGPRLREKIMNMHDVTPPVRGIRKLLLSNHGSRLGEGTVSGCLSAISRQAASGVPWAAAPGGLAADAAAACAAAGTAAAGIMDAHSGPPVGPPAREAGAAPGTRRHAPLPRPLISQIEELFGMAPYVMEDESRANVAGCREQALALLCPSAALIRITDDKSKLTMRRTFRHALDRPLVADMYLAGNAFEGDVQTCGVHVWRKSESLAVPHGIDSPEQTYSAALPGICRDAGDAAARITAAAGGPLASICEDAGALRAVPGLEREAADEIAALSERVSGLAHAYGHGEVSDAETRRYAATLENALPYMFEFLRHPGMPGNTNAVELLIKRRVVLPRKVQVGLPDWTAAENQANLQTIHANAAIWGVFSGQVVSAGRGSWKPPPTETDMLMSPPPQRPRPRVTPGRIAPAADPAIQASPPRTPGRRAVKVAAA